VQPSSALFTVATLPFPFKKLLMKFIIGTLIEKSALKCVIKYTHFLYLPEWGKGLREKFNFFSIVDFLFGNVEFLSSSNPLELCSGHFITWLYQPEGIIKDPTVWLVGARPQPKLIFKNNMNLKN
jgi:hypothetical protein